MNEYLILATSTDPYDALIQAGELHAYADTGEHDGKRVLTLLNLTDPTQPGDDLVGGWDRQGNRVVPLNQELYDAIRPLGNAKERVITDENGDPVDTIPAGEATRDLMYSYWDGWRQRALGDEQSPDPVQRLYPADNQPFAIEIRHKLFNNPAAPAADGWGFHAEIVGGADSRDPSVRSIGAYDDPEYQDVLWPTTGGFIRGMSDWQVDENGDPIEVWYTDSWDGHRLDEPREWYIALLYASTMEGRATLPVDSDGIQYLYWEHNQGGGSATFTASGIMVLSVVGAGVFTVSEQAGLIDGEAIQIDGQDATFVRYHMPGMIVIDPHIATAVGNEIYWQR